MRLEKPALCAIAGSIQIWPSASGGFEPDFRGVERQPQREMGEGLLDLARQAPPGRREGRLARADNRALRRVPGSARQFQRRAEQSLGRAPSRQDRAILAPREKRRADSDRPGL